MDDKRNHYMWVESFFFFFMGLLLSKQAMSKLFQRREAMHACRHCHSSSSCSSSRCTEAAGSYVEALVYSNGQPISDVLLWVEQKAASGLFSLPGIVIWCHDCRKMSVISYQDYVTSCGNVVQPMSESLYYTRMCMEAEILMRMQENCD